jgi:hypothetical protein
VEKGRFQRLVGKLIYSLIPLLGIVYTIGVVSQLIHSPHKSHMELVYLIFHYLKSVPSKSLLFSLHYHLKIEAYTDADWAESVMD